MSAPVESHDRGLHAFEWTEPECIRVEFDLLRQDNRSGETSAEVTVASTLPGLEGHLHQARLNLSSSSARATLAKSLAARTPGQDLDWVGLFEVAIGRTLRVHREGEPALLLRDAERPPDAGWLLPPLVLGRLPTIIFGDGGTGKSYLALAAALSIHTDQPLLGIQPLATRTVGYLDFELEAWEQRDRMRELVGEQMPDLVYRRCVGSLRDQVDPLRRMIRDNGIGFVVVDSIGPACGGPPEDSAVALGFFEALRMLGVGALCVAHVTKDGNTEKPFGSAFWHNGSRATWYAKRQADIDSSTFTIGLYNRKSNVGRLAAPLAYTFEFIDSRVKIRTADITDTPALARDLPLKFRMQQALRSGAQTYVDLATVLEADVDSVSKAARRDEGKAFTRLVGPDGITRVGLLSHAH